MKEAKAQQIDTSVPSLKFLGFLALVIVDKDGTEVHTSQEESLVPIPRSQGEAQKEVKEGDKTEELKLTIAPKEQLVI